MPQNEGHKTEDAKCVTSKQMLVCLAYLEGLRWKYTNEQSILFNSVMWNLRGEKKAFLNVEFKTGHNW